MTSGNIYSVSQVNTYIARMFSEDYLLRSILVRGEVSNCTYHASGHIYFTLKDTSSTLSCVMFSRKRPGGLSFAMKDGDSVVVQGQIRVFEKQGRFQLYVDRIVRDGVGILNERYELLKKKLEEMGMFAEEYKKPIPKYISRLGVVTAPTGAAVRDIIQIARRRNPYIEIILYPAIVQGEEAAQSIVKGIQTLDKMHLDTIIIGRGGGSLEDLWAFNEEVVAQAVFDCSTPIISAVGHEVDTVITDYVADLRAPTPSAAAELAVFDYNQFEADLSSMEAALRQNMASKILSIRRETENLRSCLKQESPAVRCSSQKMQAEELKMRLNEKMRGKLGKIKEELLLRDELNHTMTASIESWKGRMNLKPYFEQAMQLTLQDRKHTLSLLSSRLELHSPLSRLAGGYGFIADGEGHGIVSVSQVKQGDLLSIQMKDGKIKARAEEVDPEVEVEGEQQ